MRKLLIALMAVVICGVCYAQVGNNHQGAYVPLRGRKTHNDVQFKAVIIRQQNGDYVISDVTKRDMIQEVWLPHRNINF